MPLPIPNLDDRTFEQLVEEAKKLIPTYAPEWTDHNLHDPGITLIELLAWLTEATLYRMNLITEKRKLKYLKLLRASPEPPIQARVDLTFGADKSVPLEKGTVVSTKKSGKEVHFELVEGIAIASVKLEKVIVDERTGVFDRTDANQNSDLFYAPFGLNVQKGCALYLGFDAPSDTLSFMCYLYEKDLIGPGKHGDEKDYEFDNARFKWEYSVSSEEKPWKPTSPKDETKGFQNSGKLLFEKIDVGSWTSSSIIPVWRDSEDEPYYWLRCVVEECNYEYPPRIQTIRLNTVPAVHGRVITDDTEEWKSDGLPHQVFTLRHTPVLDKSLELRVDGEKWKERDDFDSSGPNDNHFILDKEKGEIRFGDGMTGRVPLVDSMIKVISYRVGGGKDGNVKAGCEWKMKNPIVGRIVNYKPATGGTDAETIEEATARFLQDLKIPYPAVTSEDFEYIAKNTPGLRVAKVKAIPNYSPAEHNKTGCVTVAIIPFTPLEFLDVPPEPSERFKNAICLHLDKHRVLGTDIHVVGPLYVRVNVGLTIALSSGFREESLRLTILERLNRFLHPVKGRENGDGWPIGRGVYRSEIYELMEKTEGVDCVVRLSLSGDKGSSLDIDGNLILPSRIATIYPGRFAVLILRKVEICTK